VYFGTGKTFQAHAALDHQDGHAGHQGALQ
jgi:branched-chain amino acid transport system ATP-binding protein